jgi:hypothetical protein
MLVDHQRRSEANDLILCSSGDHKRLVLVAFTNDFLNGFRIDTAAFGDELHADHQAADPHGADDGMLGLHLLDLGHQELSYLRGVLRKAFFAHQFQCCQPCGACECA